MATRSIGAEILLFSNSEPGGKRSQPQNLSQGVDESSGGRPQTKKLDAVVVVISYLPLASGTQYALSLRLVRLFRILAELGVDAHLVSPDGVWGRETTTRGGDEGEARGQKRGHSRFAHPRILLLSSLSAFWKTLRVTRKLRDRRPLILVSTGVWLPTLCRLASGILGQTYVHLDVPGIPYTEAALARPRLWKLKVHLFKSLFARCVESADVITTINSAHAEFIHEHYAKSAILIRDSPDTAWMEELLSIPEETCHPGDTAPATILYVGSLSRRRLDLFLEVAAQLTARKGARVVVVGDGEDLQKYRQVYEPKGIHFPGYEAGYQLRKRIEGADICYSDVWSGLGTPMKVLEYMAAGKCIVTHDQPGVKEVLSHSRNAILCEQDPVSLEKALEFLLEHPEARLRLGKQARSTITELRTDRETLALLGAYQNLALRRRITPRALEVGGQRGRKPS